MTSAATVLSAIVAICLSADEGLRSPDMLASFAKLGIEPTVTTPQELAAIIAQEAPKWADVVRTTGVKVP